MIRLENVTKYYATAKGRKYVFQNLSFELPEKTNIGVLGLNGSGKTTLLRMIGGIDYPNEGAIDITGSISWPCLLYTSPSPRDRTRSRMPSSA